MCECSGAESYSKPRPSSARASSGADIEYYVENIAPPKCICLSLLAPGPAAKVSRWRRPALSVTYSVTRGSREPGPPLANDWERGSHEDRRRRPYGGMEDAKRSVNPSTRDFLPPWWPGAARPA